MLELALATVAGLGAMITAIAPSKTWQQATPTLTAANSFRFPACARPRPRPELRIAFLCSDCNARATCDRAAGGGGGAEGGNGDAVAQAKERALTARRTL